MPKKRLRDHLSQFWIGMAEIEDSCCSSRWRGLYLCGHRSERAYMASKLSIMRPAAALRHYLFAQTKFRVHSPFVFRLIREVLEDKRTYYAFPEAEAWRRHYADLDTKLHYPDYGAGSRQMLARPSAEGPEGLPMVERSLAHLAKHAACPAKVGHLLFSLVEFLAPKTILELGTSLGIGTRYLAGPGRHHQLITLEGASPVAEHARQTLQDCPRVDIRVGPFEQTLENALEDLGRLDLAYLDGNHAEGPTLAYAKACLAHSHPGTCLILDDIHWSLGMERAWKEVVTWDQVTLSIDLGRLGLLFFRTEQREKEHFQLRW